MVNLKASKNDDRLLLKRKAKTNVVTNIEVSKKLEFFKYHIKLKLKSLNMFVYRTSVRQNSFQDVYKLILQIPFRFITT